MWNMGGKLARGRRQDISVGSGKKRGRRRKCHIRKKGKEGQIKWVEGVYAVGDKRRRDQKEGSRVERD